MTATEIVSKIDSIYKDSFDRDLKKDELDVISSIAKYVADECDYWLTMAAPVTPLKIDQKMDMLRLKKLCKKTLADVEKENRDPLTHWIAARELIEKHGKKVNESK